MVHKAHSLFILVGLLATSLSQAAEITLREQIGAPGSIVRLGDVAQIKASTQQEQTRLASLPLMPSPPPGQTSYLRAQSLRDLLQAQGEQLSSHLIGGASQVVIGDPIIRAQAIEPVQPRREEPQNNTKQSSSKIGFRTTSSSARTRSIGGVWSRPLSYRGRQAIDLAIAEAVDLWIEEQGNISETHERGEVTVPNESYFKLQQYDALNYQITLLDRKDPSQGGAFRFSVTPVEGGFHEAPLFTAEIVRKRFAVVVTEPLRRGDLLTAARVSVQAIPRDTRVKDSYDDLEQVLGLEATRSLDKGAIITRTNSASPILVRRGDAVTVHSGSGGISVRIQAIAKSDGRQGDLVTVEAYDRSEKFEARVIGRGRLAVVPVLGASLSLNGGNNVGGIR